VSKKLEKENTSENCPIIGRFLPLSIFKEPSRRENWLMGSTVITVRWYQHIKEEIKTIP
jgi:hypothetical protein